MQGRLVRLRPVREDDAPDLHPFMSDPEVTRFMSWGPYGSLEQSAGYLRWAAAQPGAYAIEQGGRAAGVTLFRVDGDHRQADLGTWVGRPHWGRGLNREAKALLLDHAFLELGLLRVQASTHVENVRSRRALERLGFSLEGVLRRFRLWKGEPWDMAMYSILPEEWAARREG